MKKRLAILLLILTYNLKAQISHIATYPISTENPTFTAPEEGYTDKKFPTFSVQYFYNGYYYVVFNESTLSPQIDIYATTNPTTPLKTIDLDANILPPATGVIRHTINIINISDKLFDSDNEIEVAFVINDDYSIWNFYIVNENGVIEYSKNNCLKGVIHNIPGSGFLLSFNTFDPATFDGICELYSLPGSMPCESCAGQINGISENTANNSSLRLLPNPTKDNISIMAEFSGEKLVEVYNISGQLVISKIVYFVGNTANIDVSSISAGTYTIAIGENQKKLVAKFVKEN